ncbi:MAG: hypothetical protein M1389_04145 [Chloroflexi bacterium]|nr:hypothetical protein [Chloroflexota bacterium]
MVSFEMLQETYDELMRLAKERGWSEQDALLTAFAIGLDELRNRQYQETGEEGKANQQRDLERLHANYSVLKFRTFHLEQDNSALDLKLAGYRAENEAMKATIMRLKRELAEEEARSQSIEAPRSGEELYVTDRPAAAESTSRHCRLESRCPVGRRLKRT